MLKSELNCYNRDAQERLLTLLPNPCVKKTLIEGFELARRETVNGCDKCLGRPACVLCINGKKRTTLAGNTYFYEKGQCLVSGIDMPGAYNVLDASQKSPFLCMSLYLNAQVFTNLLSKHPRLASNLNTTKSYEGACVIDANEDLYKAFLRLLDLAFDEEKAEVLAPLIIEEIHYLLLVSDAKAVLTNYNSLGVKSNQMAIAISYLKENLKNNIFVDEMARTVNMAPSTFYRHFKEVLGISPLQFHKQLRLYEAQRLMISEGINVSTAAYQVGYESTSQFSRDYKRLFGMSPNKDIQKRLVKALV